VVQWSDLKRHAVEEKGSLTAVAEWLDSETQSGRLIAAILCLGSGTDAQRVVMEDDSALRKQCPLRPPQSWQIQTASFDYAYAFALLGHGMVRVDSVTGLDVASCADGTYAPELAPFFLPELAYKMGFADKYGA
jgi:hypothetical protein